VLVASCYLRKATGKGNSIVYGHATYLGLSNNLLSAKSRPKSAGVIPGERLHQTLRCQLPRSLWYDVEAPLLKYDDARTGKIVVEG
jgi:hypothetical protein